MGRIWSNNSADLDLLVATALAMRFSGPTQPQKCCKLAGAEISALDSPPPSQTLNPRKHGSCTSAEYVDHTGLELPAPALLDSSWRSNQLSFPALSFNSFLRGLSTPSSAAWPRPCNSPALVIKAVQPMNVPPLTRSTGRKRPPAKRPAGGRHERARHADAGGSG